jgi:hypothetical protein
MTRASPEVASTPFETRHLPVGILSTTSTTAPCPNRRQRIQTTSLTTFRHSDEISPTLSSPESLRVAESLSDRSISVETLEEWNDDEISRMLMAPDTFGVKKNSQHGVKPNEVSRDFLDQISSLSFKDESREASQSLCAITRNIYVARSLPQLEMPSVVWTESRWGNWRSHQFSHTILVDWQQHLPSRSRHFKVQAPVIRTTYLGVEELVLNVPTIISPQKENGRFYGDMNRLTDEQMDASFEFLCEALFLHKGKKDEEVRTSSYRMSTGQCSRVLILAQDGLTCAVMAIIMAFLSYTQRRDVQTINAVFNQREDLLAEWKGLFSHAELQRIKVVVTRWREFRDSKSGSNASFPSNLAPSIDFVELCAIPNRMMAVSPCTVLESRSSA